MIAVVYEIDPQARQVLRLLLRDQGFTTVLSASSPAQFRHYLRTVAEKISLIVFCTSRPEDFQLQLFRQIQDSRDLDAAPMILVSDSFALRTGATKKLSNDFVRVDSVLKRPFGAKHLYQAIKSANEQRSMSRDVLIYFSKVANPVLSEIIYESSDTLHWRAVEQAKDLPELKAVLERIGYRAGTIMIDPEAIDLRARKWIANFKKTSIGARTPIVCLSQEPSALEGLRLECDLFVSEFDRHGSRVEDLQSILQTLSKRLLDRWTVREWTIKIRDMIKGQQYKSAVKELKIVNDLFGRNWELAELMGVASEKTGNTKEALAHYENARKANPCSPVSHLGLLRIYEGQKPNLSLAIAQAQKYCPRHPQIVSEILKATGLRVVSSQ